MPTFAFPGKLDAVALPPELAKGLKDRVRPKQSGAVQYARAGTAPQRLEAADDDIVEVELEDGLKLWARADQLAGDFGLTPARAATDVVEIRPVMSRLGESRGLGAWVVKGLKLFGIDIPEEITEFVSTRVEGTLIPGPGLYRCVASPPASWPAADAQLDASGPTLVFLHGTASSTDGSFGALWSGTPSRISGLLQHYGGRVLAFQHRSLTESPIANAVALMKQLRSILPAGAELHLVSHSRGGLIGELLARGMRVGDVPFDQTDLRLFEGRADSAALAELGKLLAEARFRIGRFVRVACPARGTTLADGRLDRYFSVLTNVVGWTPGLRENPIYEGLTSLLAGVLKKRTDPSQLPGLEAMMPSAPLVLMLNRPDVETTADLHVLGGDLEGTGLWGRLKTLATDLYYLDDHDLVVNTPAMLGGVQRANHTIRYWVDTGPEVTHFNYFRRSDTASRLVSALTSPTLPPDFRELTAAPSEITSEDYRKRAATPQPIVFVLPGIMGTTLRANERPVWIDYLALATGGLRDVRMSATGVTTGTLVASSYKKLLKHLSLTHEVVPFPYDWRQSLVESAKALRVALDAALTRAEQIRQPVRIVAHSMGGLVVRTMIATEAGRATWDRMYQIPGARFIMLGTPNAGAHAIAAMLIGRDALTRKLALLDLNSSYADLLQYICAFDGVLHLLPHAGSADLYQTAAWDDLFQNDVPSARGLFSSSVASSKSAGFAWAKPTAQQLTRAREIRALLETSPVDPTRMIYVAGVAEETACDITIDPTAPAGRRVTVVATDRGDGRVPWATGIPRALIDAGRTYYMPDVVHGDLANAEENFPALDDLLSQGTTTKLPQKPPARRSAEGETFVMRAPMPSMVPDEEDLVLEAMGSRRRRAAPSVRKVRVRVVHGNLSGAQSPVVVGHYDQDLLVSAEGYLDRQLDGRLHDLRGIGLYPGAIGTHEVVLNEPDGVPRRHPGAVVVGLGTVGDLAPGILVRTLANGFAAYGAERVDFERRRRQRGLADARTVIPTPLTVLLIGSGDAGVSLTDSLNAILRAVVSANERLGSIARTDDSAGDSAERAKRLTAFIDTIDILELFEDRAIQAVRILNRLGQTNEMLRSFQIDEILHAGRDGQTRITFDDGQEWWQRLRITSQDEAGGGADAGVGEQLKFEALTNRARAASFLLPTQRALVDRFLARATTSTAANLTLGSTLFELLLPTEFKAYAPDRRRLAVLLDEHAARYPWELLQNRHDSGGTPLAVETGMIRQILVLRDPDRRPPATGRAALVIGNPTVSDERFASLDGAEAEAGDVAELLNGRGHLATCLVGKDAEPEVVFEELYAGPWSILHFAAHGVFEFQPAPNATPVTGMVLNDGIFVTPESLAQMPFVPDIAFINCCYLGQTAGEAKRPAAAYHRFAANVGTQLIRMGVRAVIAAGWAVDDAAARVFATTFYRNLLDGQTFGEAVIAARRAAFSASPGTNTWGAYQCYGDPGFSFQRGAAPPADGPPVAARDAAFRIDAIANRAGSSTAADLEVLARELDDLVVQSKEPWLQKAAVCASIGAAYGQLKNFKMAIEYYRRAREAEDADVSLHAIEQLANLIGRSIASMEHPTAADLKGFDDAEQLLKRLIEIGETSERYSLLGSLHKRRAMAFKGKPQLTALEAMASAYRRAYDIMDRRKEPDPSYPLMNAVAAGIVLEWHQAPKAVKGRGKKGGGQAPPLAADVAALTKLAETLADDGGSFWRSALVADAMLISALHTRALGDVEVVTIARCFLEVQRRGGSPREASSALDQIRFFLRLAPKQLAPAGGANVRDALERLLETLSPS